MVVLQCVYASELSSEPSVGKTWSNVCTQKAFLQCDIFHAGPIELGDGSLSFVKQNSVT